MEDEQRMIRLEEQLMHVQREVAELNEVMSGLAEQVTRLRKELRAVEHNLHEHLSDSAEDDGGGDDVPPPHY